MTGRQKRDERIWERVDDAPELSDLAMAMLLALFALNRGARKKARWQVADVLREAGLTRDAGDAAKALSDLHRAGLAFFARHWPSGWRIQEAGRVYVSEMLD